MNIPRGSTHTYVTMDVSKTTFEEIKGKLLAASYQHCIDFDQNHNVEVLVLGHIGLTMEDQVTAPVTPS